MKNLLYSAKEADREKIEADWGSIVWIAGPMADNSDEVTVGYVTIHPGKSNPAHFHTTSGEMLHLLKGEVSHTFPGGDVHMRAGDTITVDSSFPHCARNIGSEDAEMIVVFPTGQRDFYTVPTFDRLVLSPACLPDLGLVEFCAVTRRLGFSKVEIFTEWVQSQVDVNAAADDYLEILHRYHVEVESFHLPKLEKGDGASLYRAKKGADMAAGLGARVVLVKGDSKEAYAEFGKALCDYCAEKKLTPVLQNHAGSPISNIDDVQQVLATIDHAALRVLLEVGHFAKAGVAWQDALDALKDKMAYAHIKDFPPDSVYGAGEIDFGKLLDAIEASGYEGCYVVELEYRKTDATTEKIEDLLAQSLDHLKSVAPWVAERKESA